MTTTFDVLLDSYRDIAESERMKGNYFEATRGPVSGDGMASRRQYRNVWLWRDRPDREGKKDNGMDLVADRQDGGFTAVQFLLRGPPDPEAGH